MHPIHAVTKFNLKQIIGTLLTVLFLLAANPSYAAEHPRVTVVTEVLQPYQFLDTNNNPVGYGINVLEKLLFNAGLKSNIEFLPWVRAYDKAATGKNIIILAIARTAERELDFHWIGSIHKETFSFYTLRDNKHIDKITSMDDLKNYSIVVTKDSVLDKYLTDHNIPVVERSIDVEQTYKMLFKNRVDLIFKSHASIKTQTNNFGYDYNDLKEVFLVPNLSADLHIAISKNSDMEIVRLLQNEFNLLVENGELTQYKRDWGIE